MLTEAMDKHTKWLDGQIAFISVDKALTKKKFEEKEYFHHLRYDAFKD